MMKKILLLLSLVIFLISVASVSALRFDGENWANGINSSWGVGGMIGAFPDNGTVIDGSWVGVGAGLGTGGNNRSFKGGTGAATNKTLNFSRVILQYEIKYPDPRENAFGVTLDVNRSLGTAIINFQGFGYHFRVQDDPGVGITLATNANQITIYAAIGCTPTFTPGDTFNLTFIRGPLGHFDVYRNGTNLGDECSTITNNTNNAFVNQLTAWSVRGSNLIRVSNLLLCEDTCETFVEAVAPEITEIVLTSDPVPNVCNAGPDNFCGATFDKSPTFNLTTDVSANCKINQSNLNFSSMGGTTCATTGGVNHVCTFPFNLPDNQNNTLFFGCESGGEESADATSNAIVFTVGDAAVTGDTVELLQFLDIQKFNNTHVTFNRTFVATNFFPISKSFDFPVLVGWTIVQGSDPLVVEAQSSNRTVYQQVFERGQEDVLFNVSSTTTTDAVAIATEFFDLLPVDPPFKFCTFTESRQLTGETLVCDTLSVSNSAELSLVNTQISASEKVVLEVGSQINQDTASEIVIG